MKVEEANRVTDADALLPNGCELNSYNEHCRSTAADISTKSAVINRSRGQNSDLANKITSDEPLLTREKSQCGSNDAADLQSYLQDPISYAVGEFGKWQLQLTFLLALFNFPCTWHIFVLTFQSETGGKFWCSRPTNLKQMNVSEWINISGTSEMARKGNWQYNPCMIRDLDYSQINFSKIQPNNVDILNKCDSWEFEASNTGDTIVSEWGLVCDKEQLRHVAEMMFLLGVAFGGFFSGLVSDKFGRKKTLMISLVFQIILGISVGVCPWFGLFLVLRVLLGFACVSVVFSGLILCMELVGGKWLTISGVSYMFPVPLSYIIIAGVAYICRGWRSLQLTITLPSILFIAFWWILPESPRWLLTMGKIDKLMEVLKDAARINKKILPHNFDKILKQSISAVDRPKGRISDLFRTPTIRTISIVLYVVWFSVYLVYYGLVLNLSNIGGDVYINSIISGIVEVPAIGLSILILLKMGRRIPLCLTLVCSGIACFLTLAVPYDPISPNGASNNFKSSNVNENSWEWLTITLAMVGKFSISSSNVIMPVYTAELFPTVIRNLGVGSSNVPAGIALMIVPYLWNMAAMNHHLPMIILGVTGIVGGISVLLLPETSKQGLTATLEDIEEESRYPNPQLINHY